MSKNLNRCPACRGKGYFIKPDVSIIRCEVCKGRGVCTLTAIMAWEWSL